MSTTRLLSQWMFSFTPFDGYLKLWKLGGVTYYHSREMHNSFSICNSPYHKCVIIIYLRDIHYDHIQPADWLSLLMLIYQRLMYIFYILGFAWILTDSIYESVNQWVSELMRKWVNEWISERISQLNNYIVRSYIDIIVVTNTATRRTNKT